VNSSSNITGANTPPVSDKVMVPRGQDCERSKPDNPPDAPRSRVTCRPKQTVPLPAWLYLRDPVGKRMQQSAAIPTCMLPQSHRPFHLPSSPPQDSRSRKVLTVPWRGRGEQAACRTGASDGEKEPAMTADLYTSRSSLASPGQGARRDRLTRLYDELGDVAKQELLQFAEDLSDEAQHPSVAEMIATAAVPACARTLGQ
jgi:hypothetical protein